MYRWTIVKSCCIVVLLRVCDALLVRRAVEGSEPGWWICVLWFRKLKLRSVIVEVEWMYSGRRGSKPPPCVRAGERGRSEDGAEGARA